MIQIPPDADTCDIKCGGRNITLTNLRKVFWPALGKTKRDLLLYYSELSRAILPHLKNRAVLMKRYPNGIEGKSFFIKHTPPYRPHWLRTCSIAYAPGLVIDLPMAQDIASLLWIVNLGCIDLHPWYARCDDLDRPDFLHFDLDPIAPAGFAQVRNIALLVKAYLDERKVQSLPETSGSRGIHIYVPIHREPVQSEVWTVAKRIAFDLARRNPTAITAERRITLRPPGRVLVNFDQNAWGRTLASVYSVRPQPQATVSAPVTWEEVEAGISASDLTIDTVPARVHKVGDLFKPLLRNRGRCHLETLE